VLCVKTGSRFSVVPWKGVTKNRSVAKGKGSVPTNRPLCKRGAKFLGTPGV